MEPRCSTTWRLSKRPSQQLNDRTRYSKNVTENWKTSSASKNMERTNEDQGSEKVSRHASACLIRFY